MAKKQKKSIKSRMDLGRGVERSKVERALEAKSQKGLTTRLFLAKTQKDLEREKKYFEKLPQWQKEQILNQPGRLFSAATSTELLLFYWGKSRPLSDSESSLNPSEGARFRDLMGPVIQQMDIHSSKNLEIHIASSLESFAFSMGLGLELAQYRFRVHMENKTEDRSLKIISKQAKVSEKDFRAGAQLGVATNLARHLTNLPPNFLHPVSYADFVKKLFSKTPHVRVEIWDEKRLEKEKMGLHLAVGQGSSSPPRLVHIRYRPPTGKTKSPIAFVGKGVTFDSGGLDLKPASAMRLMKKDMGGSAAVVGIAWWAAQYKLNQPLDFYLGLAENSVSGKAFRPGDILTARSGLSVEIHNTDAEGRLVLADALDVAVTQSGKDEPSYVIDIATLTGAIKVALGSQLAGLFANTTSLREQLYKASSAAGDLCWPMPLYQNYRTSMASSVASMTNSVDGFGGAVTAALFLESFVRQKKWAHLDIYAWKDSPEGALQESGGSGQAVQMFAQWLKNQPGS